MVFKCLIRDPIGIPCLLEGLASTVVLIMLTTTTSISHEPTLRSQLSQARAVKQEALVRTTLLEAITFSRIRQDNRQVEIQTT